MTVGWSARKRACRGVVLAWAPIMVCLAACGEVAEEPSDLDKGRDAEADVPEMMEPDTTEPEADVGPIEDAQEDAEADVPEMMDVVLPPDTTEPDADVGPIEDAPDEDMDESPVECDGVIDGDVLLEGDSDLSELRGVRVVFGDLTVFATQVRDLRHLECLEDVSGNLRIIGNAQLRSLDGLDALRSVGGDLEVGGYLQERLLDYIEPAYIPPLFLCGAVDPGNDALTSVAALRGLETVGGSLTFQDNVSLVSLDGFESLSSVGGDLRLVHTAVEVVEEGTFPSLVSVGGVLLLGNTALRRVDGLGRVSEVRGDVRLGGFFSERPVEDYCALYGSVEDPACMQQFFAPECFPEMTFGNPVLESVVLPLISSVGGSLVAVENPRLEQLEFDALQTVRGGLQIGGAVPVRECRPLGERCWDVPAPAGSPVLAALGGFPVLSAVGSLTVQHTGARSIAFPALTHVAGDLTIGGRASYIEGRIAFNRTHFVALDNVEPDEVSFPRLREVTGTLIVSGPGPLLAGFGALEGVGRDLVLETLAERLVGPPALRSVGNDLRIQRSGAAALEGFNALETIGGSLAVGGPPDVLDSFCEFEDRLSNGALSEVTGFPRLSAVGRDFVVVDNGLLDAIAAQAFRDRIPRVSGRTHICQEWTPQCSLERTGYGFLCSNP